MPTLRFNALAASSSRSPIHVEEISNKRSGIYCDKVFTQENLRH
jgi:hypothetical protein